LSEIVIVSGESISMVSEAVSSGKYVVVFKLEKRRRKTLCLLEGKIRQRETKHERFLESLKQKGFITLAPPENLAEIVKRLWMEKSPSKTLDDNQIICKAVKGLL
jgi:mitochondrial fission protein ELM1